MMRRCDYCKQPLAGRRGHGFPTPDGKAIQCGACKERSIAPVKRPPIVHAPPSYAGNSTYGSRY